MANAPRSTATRDKHRRYIRRGHPPCALCGDPIDYELPHSDLMSYTVDHIVALANGGSDELDNKQPAHRKCNREKSDRLPEDDAPRTFVTARTW